MPDAYAWPENLLTRRAYYHAHLTTTMVTHYLAFLKDLGYSVSHRTRVKSVLSGFCQWLIEEQGVL